MRLTVLGSANASNAGGRRHSCYWLEGALAEGALLLDCGGTALAGIKELGLDPRRARVLALTHLHGDHVGGFPTLVIDALYDLRRAAPLLVVGPLGAQARLEALLELSYPGLATKRPWPFELSWVELAPGASWEGLGARVEAFAADHQDPPERPLCLRVRGASGRAVAFSGDTRLCEGLFQAAAGADLLVAECSALAPPCGAHSSWEEWRGAAARLGDTRLLLTHLGEDVRAGIPALLAEGLPGVATLGFAEDGLALEV
ncbi:MAG: MBL fold metallo-hydrolase [Planctomycetota bacterium]